VFCNVDGSTLSLPGGGRGVEEHWGCPQGIGQGLEDGRQTENVGVYQLSEWSELQSGRFDTHVGTPLHRIFQTPLQNCSLLRAITRAPF